MSLLWQARFYTTVHSAQNLPKFPLPEVAFAGRSNAGKSTAINVLCHQKKLAFSSKTPGRTQDINYFSLGGATVGQHRKDPVRTEEIRGFLVDLPGYGYAKVPEAVKQRWQNLLAQYLEKRTQLQGLILLVDARHPFTPLDRDMVECWLPTKKPLHCLLTKSDKLTQTQARNALQLAQTFLNSYVDAQGQTFPLTVQLFSAHNNTGHQAACRQILRWLQVLQKISRCEKI